MSDPSVECEVDGVFFTNHWMGGYVQSANLEINGTMISRDDGLYFQNTLTLNHDIRLLDSSQTSIVALPGGIKRLKMRGWKDVSRLINN